MMRLQDHLLLFSFYYLKVMNVLCIMFVFTKEKERVHNWWDNVINNFVYFNHKCLQGLLMDATFISF